MKKTTVTTILALTLGSIGASPSILAQENASEQIIPPHTMSLEEARTFFSYNIGVNIASQFAGEKFLDTEEVKKGFLEALAGKTNAQNIDRQKMQQAQAILAAKQMEELEKEADAFLEINKQKEGVQTTQSGLQYKVTKKGSGKKPTATDTVEVHYTGKLPDGTVFDSSVQRGTPVKFPLNQVIPGWTEGIQLMETGSTYEFVIPAALAYGKNGTPDGKIPPNSPLIFEVALLNIAPPSTTENKKN